MKTIFKLGFGVVILPLLFSCSKSEDVVATVNGKDISRTTINAYLKHKRVPVDKQDAAKIEIERYLNKTALAEVITEQNLLDNASIDVEIDEFRKQMLISRYFERFLQDKVDEQAVKNFYASNPERYQSKKSHVAHILFRTNPKMSEQEREALLTRAHEAYSKATTGEDFAALAEQYSEDKMSVPKGGDLGWIQEGAIDPAFSKTAFELTKDEISTPIVTPFGFHIVKVLDEAQVVTQPFESVKGNIRYELRQMAKQAEMDRLKGLVNIEMNESANEEG